jgi:hypothetical protein
MQPVQHRNRHKPATQPLRPIDCRIRIRYPVQFLMHAAVVVPADEFPEYTPKMPFIPDQHTVEIDFPAQSALDLARNLAKSRIYPIE